MGKEPKPFEILVRAFPGIPHDEAEELIAYGEVRSFPSETIICHENALASTFYIILQGKVKVSKFINQKKERELKTLKAGDFFGEMALIHNAPRAATVTTVMPTSVLEIKKVSFDRLMRRSASLSMTMAREVSRRLQENEAMAIEDLRIKAGEMAMAYERLAEQEFSRREFLIIARTKLESVVDETLGDLDRVRKETSANGIPDSPIEQLAVNVRKIITALNEILFLHEIDMILPEPQKVNLDILLLNIASQNQIKAEQKEIKIQVETSEDELYTLGDPTSIERALNILSNFAIDASPKDETVLIKASYVNSGIDVEFRFVGAEYSQDTLTQLFDHFPYSLNKDSDPSGLKRELPLARQIIEQYGGEITAIDNNGREKNLTVHLQASC
jgi:CRP-like cAMP-binding protein